MVLMFQMNVKGDSYILLLLVSILGQHHGHGDQSENGENLE